MTDGTYLWMTDGLTARILGTAAPDDLEEIARWLDGDAGSCTIKTILPAGSPAFTNGRIERITSTMCCGTFAMEQGMLRGASVHIWTSYPATFLTSIGGEDAADVIGWEMLRGLRIIDAGSYPKTDSLPVRTRIRLDAPLQPLLPLLGGPREDGIV